MNLNILLLSAIKIVFCFTPVLVESIDDVNPTKICLMSSKVGVIANARNVLYLMKLLEESHVESAYVFGWEDHKKVMVLYKNGTLVPYIKGRNDTRYALVVCICPGKPRDMKKEINYKHTTKSATIVSPSQSAHEITSSQCAPEISPSQCAPIISPSQCEPEISPNQCAPITSPSQCTPIISSSQCDSIISPSQCAPIVSPSKCAPEISPSQCVSKITSSQCAPEISPSQCAPIISPNLCSTFDAPSQCNTCEMDGCHRESRNIEFQNFYSCGPINTVQYDCEYLTDCNGEEQGLRNRKIVTSKVYEFKIIDEESFELVQKEHITCKTKTEYRLKKTDCCSPAEIPEILFSPDEIYCVHQELNETYNQEACL